MVVRDKSCHKHHTDFVKNILHMSVEINKKSEIKIKEMFVKLDEKKKEKENEKSVDNSIDAILPKAENSQFPIIKDHASVS